MSPSPPTLLPAAKRPRHEYGTGSCKECDGCSPSDPAAREVMLAGVANPVLRQMQDMTELCDVSLRVRNESGEWTSLRAHRLVLAASSDVLKAMLLGGFRECSQDTVTLEDLPAWAVQALLDFIYTGRAAVRSERLLEMARVADYVKLLDLRSQCVARAVSSLEVANAAEMLAEADAMGLSELKQASTSLLLREYTKVVQTQAFSRLSSSLLQDLLKRDELRVRREEEVFESVVAWLKVDPSRRADAEHILPLVRFPRMSPQYLLSKVEREDAVRDCSVLPELLREAKNHLLLSLSSAQMVPSLQVLHPQTARTRPRAEYGDVLIEGNQPCEPQADCMGVYELQDRVVNGRPVYQQQSEADLYLYYASTDKWYISDGEDMRSGRARGWCQVVSQAARPDQISEEWTVWDSTTRSWESAPRVKCRQMNEAIRRELAAKQQVQEAEARRQAQQVGDIVVEGQALDELQADCMGAYELQEQVVNGRPVYRQQGGADMYLFYASRGCKWCISDGEDMWAGRPKGWCYVVSQALTPDQITEQWEVVADDGGSEAYWRPAPHLRARPRTRHD
eukprot:gnl/TRDRNA2_/TRDRNA2_40706_c0_seq1.p1 gnl/TRDRNA2_/TRDRNA2_40706_c0~~gnl/TRDRNA2_/TRDRNA2_40706_c0_seq1.p1  ORF type:complete len:566 (+),score=104.32 gnl/TRDRNA2_/TRDRNA2_40706_c0_seq1:34-1731(+)